MRRAAAIMAGLVLAGSAGAIDAQWITGCWRLAHDPEDRPADALEFRADGDVDNVWADGTRVPGFYVVAPDMVKAVFTRNGRDVITVFHYDSAHTELRIVTSRTGRESIYRKKAARGPCRP